MADEPIQTPEMEFVAQIQMPKALYFGPLFAKL